MKISKLSSAWCAAALLFSAGEALANSLVTFQVDMTQAASDGTYSDGQTVSVHGTFNSWNGLTLTNNPAGANPYLFTGTADVPANGNVIEFKYVIDPSTWESVPKGANRLIRLPVNSGDSLLVPKAYFKDQAPNQVAVTVVFSVDLAQQINVANFDPNTSLVFPKGTFNGWSSYDGMTNNPDILRTNQYGLVTANVYQNAYQVTGAPGQTMDYKFYMSPGNFYENLPNGVGDPSDNNNRFLIVPQSDGEIVTLPLVNFSEQPYAPVATNLISLSVDLTAQVINGNYDPTTGSVEIRGEFNNWGGTQVLCTNDPASANPNLYSTTVSVVNGIGATEGYKFWATVPVNSGWETIANNRTLRIVAGAAQVIPTVFFSDVNPNDLVKTNTLVTFQVNMAGANAVPWQGNPAFAFDTGVNGVYLNGDCLTNGWYGVWGGNWPETQLFDDGVLGDVLGGDKVYTFRYLVPAGKTLKVTYKYGIDSGDNEAPSGRDHVRYIRASGNFVMPPDTFGTIVQEPEFGNLTVGQGEGGRIHLSWLGYPGVHLQVAQSLNGAWTDLMATDGLSHLSYPISTGQSFFRLVKP